MGLLEIRFMRLEGARDFKVCLETRKPAAGQEIEGHRPAVDGAVTHEARHQQCPEVGIGAKRYGSEMALRGIAEFDEHKVTQQNQAAMPRFGSAHQCEFQIPE